MTLPIADGNDLGLAVSQNCVNKIASIVYHAGILPTAIEGDLIPASGCLSAILALFTKPSSYRYHADLKQPSFDFIGNGQIRITGGADANLLVDGTPQASISFDLVLPVTASLVAPGNRPTQPDQPQVKVEFGHPEVTSHVTGLPSNLQWVMNQIGEAVGAFFVDHVLSIPAFPAFFDDQGYGVILRGLEVTPDQLVIRSDLEWPGRTSISHPPPPSVAPVRTEVPFTLRPPFRQTAPQATIVSGSPGISTPGAPVKYRPLPPVIRPGDVSWPDQGQAYDFAIALNQKPIQDVLNEKFPISFSHHFNDPPFGPGRIDFTAEASFQLMDAAIDKIKLGAHIKGSNSPDAVIHCSGEANFKIEVALMPATEAVKGQAAAQEVVTFNLDCGVGGLPDWLGNPGNISEAIGVELQKRFGEPLIPLTFTIFQHTIGPNLSVSIQLSKVDIVQNELQALITINEAAAPHWHWQLSKLPGPNLPIP